MTIYYIILGYLFVGLILGYSAWDADKKAGILLPKREYLVRQPLFWLIDIINQLFFEYDEDNHPRMGV